jgi:hypothetical protein
LVDGKQSTENNNQENEQPPIVREKVEDGPSIIVLQEYHKDCFVFKNELLVIPSGAWNNYSRT